MKYEQLTQIIKLLDEIQSFSKNVALVKNRYEFVKAVKEEGDLLIVGNSSKINDLLNDFRTHIELTENLESLNKVREFIHQARSPLTLFSELHKTTMKAFEKEAERKTILIKTEDLPIRYKRIGENAKRMKRQVVDFLYLHENINEIDLQHERITIAELSSIVQDLSSHTESSEIFFNTILASPNEIICIDAEKAQEVIETICINAIEAIGDSGGKGYVAVSFELKPDSLIIEIGNSGPAISEKDKANIFQQFYSTKKHLGGNGLGLYVVKKILSRMNGDIQIKTPTKNDLDSGINTIFEITIPLEAQ